MTRIGVVQGRDRKRKSALQKRGEELLPRNVDRGLRGKSK